MLAVGPSQIDGGRMGDLLQTVLAKRSNPEFWWLLLLVVVMVLLFGAKLAMQHINQARADREQDERRDDEE
jgi:hypothetical protein